MLGAILFGLSDPLITGNPSAGPEASATTKTLGSGQGTYTLVNTDVATDAEAVTGKSGAKLI